MAILLIGKRLVCDGDYSELNALLRNYNLISNLGPQGGSSSVRRLEDPSNIHRYSIIPSFYGETNGGRGALKCFDVCVGKILGSAGDLIDVNVHDLTRIVQETTIDFPDAQLLAILTGHERESISTHP